MPNVEAAGLPENPNSSEVSEAAVVFRVGSDFDPFSVDERVALREQLREYTTAHQTE